MGHLARRSTSTNRTENTTAAAMSAQNAGDHHSMTEPPSEVAITSDDRATVMARVPRTSNPYAAPLTRRAGRVSTTDATAITASGRFIQKAQRQPITSVKNPPSSGPTIVGTTNAMPMMPM